jgi:hypothetical protein
MIHRELSCLGCNLGHQSYRLYMSSAGPQRLQRSFIHSLRYNTLVGDPVLWALCCFELISIFCFMKDGDQFNHGDACDIFPCPRYVRYHCVRQWKFMVGCVPTHKFADLIPD